VPLLLVAVVALVVVPAGASGAAGAPATAPAFDFESASVTPRHAYVAGRPVRIAFTIDAPAPLGVDVDVVRDATGKPVRRFRLPVVAAGVEQRLDWDGVTGGEGAPNGAYHVRATSPDGTRRRVAREFTLRSHVYPIRGPHADRGPIGAFGVGRNGGRTHNGFDVNAPCATPIVAARGGRVVRATYDPVLYGNLVIVRGDHTRRDYWYAHMRRATRLRAGDHVLTGQRIGSIGDTGNARTIGCHLHFEIRVNGTPIDPAPELHAWDAWS
jgi:murein DD-endopeptidase MepM/ murein hydrolase activator NlpD